MSKGVHNSPRGSPKFEPTKDDRQLVKILAGILTPHREIAMVIQNPHTGRPISTNTLEAAFKGELTHGRAQSKAFAVGKLFKLIAADHPAAIMFYLKTQCGFRETSVNELTGPRGGPIPLSLSGEVKLYMPDNGRTAPKRGNGHS